MGAYLFYYFDFIPCGRNGDIDDGDDDDDDDDDGDL